METKKVYEAIAKVSETLSREGIAKGRKNQAQGYSFRGIDDVYNALAPALAAARLCILPNVLSREVVERESAKGGALFYTTVRVEFIFACAEDGSTHSVVTYGEAMDSGDKSTNKAMSAAYKYAAMQAFCIPTEGDNDADSQTHEVKAHGASRPGDGPAKITPTTGEWESHPIDVQNALSDCAYRVSALLKRGDIKGAFDELEAEKLENDLRVAIWTRFDSKERAALKKEAESRKPVKEAA
jgi:ERF superfamily protein